MEGFPDFVAGKKISGCAIHAEAILVMVMSEDRAFVIEQMSEDISLFCHSNGAMKTGLKLPETNILSSLARDQRGLFTIFEKR